HTPRLLAPSSFFLYLSPRPPLSTLFPYTTLFRSRPCRPTTTQGDGVPPTWPPATATGCGDPCPPGPPRPRSRRGGDAPAATRSRSEEHTSELQSLRHLVCRLLLEKKKKKKKSSTL